MHSGRVIDYFIGGNITALQLVDGSTLNQVDRKDYIATEYGVIAPDINPHVRAGALIPWHRIALVYLRDTGIPLH